MTGIVLLFIAVVAACDGTVIQLQSGYSAPVTTNWPVATLHSLRCKRGYEYEVPRLQNSYSATTGNVYSMVHPGTNYDEMDEGTINFHSAQGNSENYALSNDLQYPGTAMIVCGSSGCPEIDTRYDTIRRGSDCRGSCYCNDYDSCANSANSPMNSARCCYCVNSAGVCMSGHGGFSSTNIAQGNIDSGYGCYPKSIGGYRYQKIARYSPTVCNKCCFSHSSAF